MAKVVLTEALEFLQEHDPLISADSPASDNTGARGPRPRLTNPRSWIPIDDKNPFPYDAMAGEGPANASGHTGMQGIGRGGIGLGGREDVHSGVREPSAIYNDTWQQDDVDESADFEELERHGDPRNLWRDTPDAKNLRDKIEGDLETESVWLEAMGSPTQTGPVAPMDGPSMSLGRSAKPVKDEDGEEISPDYMPDPVDPMRGPNNMWGGAGTVPGATRGWANAPANQKKIRRENLTMRLREFFDPSPIAVEEIDNPEQDQHGDSTDDEIERGDEDGMESDEVEVEIGADDFDGMEDEGGIEDLIGKLSSMADTEPGDGQDIGAPNGNIAMTPKMGPTNFVASPDKMGSARGTFGLHSDSQGAGSVTQKSSAWDVLKKVVDAMGEEDEEPIV